MVAWLRGLGRGRYPPARAHHFSLWELQTPRVESTPLALPHARYPHGSPLVSATLGDGLPLLINHQSRISHMCIDLVISRRDRKEQNTQDMKQHVFYLMRLRIVNFGTREV